MSEIRRRQRRKQDIKPLIFVAIFFVLVALCGLGITLMVRYTPSNKIADYNTYFKIVSKDRIPVIIEDSIEETQAKLIEDQLYFPLELVKERLNPHFYYEPAEELLLCTLASEVIELDYRLEDGETFILAEDVKKCTDMEYQLYQEPGRVSITLYEGSEQHREVVEDAKLRVEGNIKSSILTEVVAGAQVTELEAGESWSLVKVEGFIGFLPNEALSDTGIVVNLEERATMPEYTSITRDFKINLSWHVVTTAGANEQLEDRIAEADGLNVISPTWFRLQDTDGNISSLASQEYVQKAHDLGIEVWALVDNFDHDVDFMEMLSHTSKRNNAVTQLIDLALEYNLDGINLDFESIPSDGGEAYVQFIRELSVACRKQQLVLSVDNYVPRPHTAHYNRAEQGIVADYVIIMGYDEHYSGSSESGSVASIGFVDDGIQRTLEEVPAHKIINAVPFYMRVWTETSGASGEIELSSRAIGMEEADQLIRDMELYPVWNQETGQYYSEYETEEGVNKIWFENAASIEEKMKLIQSNNLAGVASWRLGFEKPEIWKVMKQYLQNE